MALLNDRLFKIVLRLCCLQKVDDFQLRGWGYDASIVERRILARIEVPK